MHRHSPSSRSSPGRRYRRRVLLSTSTAALAVLGVGTSASRGVIIYQSATSTATWNNTAQWNPATIPNNVGDNATFNGNATAGNPAQIGNRTATLDGAKTVGSITFNND